MRVGIEIIRLVYDFLFLRSVVLVCQQPPGQFFRRGEFVQTDISLLPGGEVILSKSVSVGAVGKLEVKNFGINFRLSYATADGMVVILRFDNGDGVLVGFGLKQIVCAFLRFSCVRGFPLEDDSSICKRVFHPHMLTVPSGIMQRRSNISRFYILFG